MSHSLFPVPELTLAAALLLIGCEPNGSSTDERPHDEVAANCLREASDAAVQLNDSLESVPQSVAVIVARRNHEQICLHEARCLKIDEARLAPFLEKCLAAVE